MAGPQAGFSLNGLLARHAADLGAQQLQAEESTNYSLGAVFRFGDLDVTIDAYRIDINDRIVLSENLTQANVRAFLQGQGFVGVGVTRDRVVNFLLPLAAQAPVVGVESA